MAAARERCRGETKGVDPARIGRDIAQLGVEHRDAGRDLVDEMPQPIRREGTALAADACCHSCANIWARRILGFSDLKKHEVVPGSVLAQYSVAARTSFTRSIASVLYKRQRPAAHVSGLGGDIQPAIESAPASRSFGIDKGASKPPCDKRLQRFLQISATAAGANSLRADRRLGYLASAKAVHSRHRACQAPSGCGRPRQRGTIPVR